MPIVDRINALSGVNTGGSIEDALRALEDSWEQGGGTGPGKSGIKIEYDAEDELVSFTTVKEEDD